MTGDSTEVKKLQSALFTMIASSVSGKAQEAFWARENLRNAVDLVDGRIAPCAEDAPQLTGIKEFYEEAVQEAYRILGAPAPHQSAFSMAH